MVCEALPEVLERYRTKPPKETFVLHGWVAGEKHLEWVEREKLYNYRTESARGSLRLHESVAGASYLLLHGANQYRGGSRLFRIVSDGPRVFSKETLLEKGYPGSGSQLYYLVYDVKPLGVDDPLFAYDWDLSKVDGVGEGHQSALPKKGIPLSEFMKGARVKT